jgi:uncharacterized protein (DUF2132 family)
MNSHPKDPLHGFTLETIVTRLVEEYGWTELANRIRIRCFAKDPSIKSTLTFLRKTPWARDKVEALFIETLNRKTGL